MSYEAEERSFKMKHYFYLALTIAAIIVAGAGSRSEFLAFEAVISKWVGK